MYVSCAENDVCMLPCAATNSLYDPCAENDGCMLRFTEKDTCMFPVLTILSVLLPVTATDDRHLPSAEQ